MYQNILLLTATSSAEALAGYLSPNPHNTSFSQSLKKYSTTASSVPACSATSNAKPGSGQCSSHGNKIRCAVLLTGKNSVNACTSARIIAWMSDIRLL